MSGVSEHSRTVPWCSIVVPVFNAEMTLRDIHAGLVEHMAKLGRSFELILVDDCSRDASWEVIEELAHRDARVRGLQLMRNSGQSAATIAGLIHAQGALIVTMDDDLQNPPHEVPRLCRFMDEHPEIDAAFGLPRQKYHAFWRRGGSTFVHRLSNRMFGQPGEFQLTSFRIMRREVMLPLLRLNVREPAIGALLTTITKRLTNVEVDHAPRVRGRSGYSMRKLLRLTLSKFLGFSTFPLRFLAFMGMFGIVISLIFGATILYRYFFGNITVPGWTTLTLLLVGLSGFMFLGFGIVGEYLQQILDNTRGRPSFVVRATHGTVEPLAPEPEAVVARTVPTHS